MVGRNFNTMTQPQFYFFIFFISAVDTFILEKGAIGQWLLVTNKRLMSLRIRIR